VELALEQERAGRSGELWCRPGRARPGSDRDGRAGELALDQERAANAGRTLVCRQLGLHWTSVMRLIKRWVEESAARQFKKPLRVIGVDEVSYGRGKTLPSRAGSRRSTGRVPRATLRTGAPAR
jgi:hypothetical protein